MQQTLPRSMPLLLRPQQLRRPVVDKIQERFMEFHNANPAVYRKLVELARQVKAAGKETYGIESLFSRLRWHHEIETKGEPFKLNNIFTSRYARLIMDQETDLKGFFLTRQLVSMTRRLAPQRAAA